MCAPACVNFNVDPELTQYDLTVANTVQGTPPDTTSWMVSVLRIRFGDTTVTGNQHNIPPNGTTFFRFQLHQWSEHDRAFVVLDVDAPCAVVGDSARATELSVRTATRVEFTVSCP